MFYLPIVEMIKQAWSKFMAVCFPHLKYRDNRAIPRRDVISERVIKSFKIMWLVSLAIGGVFGLFIKSGIISNQLGIWVIAGLLVLAIGIFLVGNSMKPVSGDYWQKWWRGEIQWWKILRF